MTPDSCTIAPRELLEYWLGEVDAARERALDEHLFGCAQCTALLGEIAALGRAIRGELLAGNLTFVVPEPFVRRLKDAGFRVREYAPEPGGSVDCTVAADDDFVVSYLRAPLAGVQRLDLVIDDSTSGRHRAHDVAFAPGGVVAVTSTAYLRTLDVSRQHVRLVAVDGADERVIADYTFNHTPS